MSGIYIKDADFPTRCGRCDFCVSYPIMDGATQFQHECVITGAIVTNGGEKLADCPLVPVPDHGRLIDADAIGIAEHEERFVKRADRGDWMDEYIVGIVDGLHEAGRRIINAPTIIPADKGVDA